MRRELIAAQRSIVARSQMLLLFDIDGTLLLDDAYAGGAAMERALRSVYGVAVADGAVAGSDPWGKTDSRIAREILRAAGLGDEAIDAGMGAWQEAAGRAFAEEAERRAAGWRARPGTAEALRALAAGGHVLAVLSGNLEAVARVKLERLGVGDLFAPGGGAFGSDAEERERLVPLARRRAGDWPRASTVVVGDTPRDVAAARADGARCVVFASDRFDAAALTGADAVISGFDELPAALASLER